MREYTIIFQKENKYYVVTCVQLRVVSQGKTLKEARSNIKEAIELYLEDSTDKYRYHNEAPMISTIKVRA